MRIVFVLPPPDLSGGIRVIAVYAERLKQRGHHVTLVYPPNRTIPLKRRIGWLLRGKGWASQPRFHPSHIDGLNVEKRVLKTWRPVTASDVPDANVVIATWWETADWVAALPESKGAKAYFLQHFEVHEPAWAPHVRRTWSLPLHKIVVAEWLAEVARAEFGDGDVSVVPNSVDTTFFDARDRTKQPVPTVGFMYSVAPWKGSDIARKAIEQARKTVPELRCLGFGAMAATAELPLPAGAEYYVRPPQGEIPKLYARADAWLVPSRSEGFGLPILEAMACGTPVIATPTGAAPELLGDGTGIVVPHEDPNALAEAIVSICRASTSEWHRMSERAYTKARSYTWDDATARFEGALEAAIDKARSKQGAQP
ncbi:MAG: glycosyltransferase family 4 protein [Candidatus Hydrogenedentales bacterium]|jgi:glycosyltransferase involved in cell wall biosynthesis